MATIKAIESRSVHQIQSGQVIVDLVSVVKELVENSLDAGATSIDVRFKNQGLESIEVQDNGKGIGPEDFETIALKHHTSKLSSYEDLTSLDTFGFRGEALSSLCALSNFHIVTSRTEDASVGKKLEFETSGKLKSTSVVAAQRGTTVSVEGLFNSLPVRRKELEKNIKREYGKTISHLYAYACISVGVRFSVSNQMPKAKKTSVFSTKSNTTTMENITNVFGAKTILALVKLDLQLEMEPSKGPSTQSARNWSTQATDQSREVRVQGHISKPIFGEGRQAPDRQMFFINSRPFALPQVTKAVNEVYKAFNVSQNPFVFANLIMDTNAYDVNVSPDKRTIMLHDQTALLESLKRSLTELFAQTDHTVPQSQLPNRKLPGFKPLTVPHRLDEEDAPSEESESDEESESGEAAPKSANAAARRTDITPPSLIQDWAGRDTEMRKKQRSLSKDPESLSKDKQKLVQSIQRERAENVEEEDNSMSPKETLQTPVTRENHDSAGEGFIMDAEAESSTTDEAFGVAANHHQEPDPMGSPYDDLSSQRPSHLSRCSGDDDVLKVPVVPPSEPADRADRTLDELVAAKHGNSEQTIPAVTSSSQKATPGLIQNAFDRMRPKRTALQTAEITVGDTTTTTVIGSGSPYKRRRIHQPVHPHSIAQFGGSPLLARGLRNFAAPGSQMRIDSSDAQPVASRSPDSDHDEAEKSSPEEDDDLAQTPEMNGSAFATARPQVPISSDAPTSDPLDALLPALADDDEFDEDYVDEQEKKLREDEKVARLIHEAELAAIQPTEANLRRASQMLKNTGNRKESPLQLAQYLDTSVASIKRQLTGLKSGFQKRVTDSSSSGNHENAVVRDEIDDPDAESRLSLIVNKADFERMIIVGQFNLGFILAIRPALSETDEDELFIIDQHASDERYNYERLRRTVTLQSQRLVRPKPLELTAVEEEIILNNADALKANGFEIETTSNLMDEDEDTVAGRRCRLLTLPMSREKTFDLSDLEELLHLLSEAPTGSLEIPRPKKVQRMLASRACRSSTMIGKALTLKQMQKIVRHMGEIDRCFNCPHGRPTVRHLASLDAWSAWQEGDVIDSDGDDATDRGARTDWASFLAKPA